MFALSPPRPAERTPLELLEPARLAAAGEAVAGERTLRLVELLYALGRDAEIVALLRDRQFDSEVHCKLTLWLGRALAGSEAKPAEACDAFIRAGASAPDRFARAEALSGLALALLDRGEIRQARRAIDQALTEDPDNSRTMRQLAHVYLRDNAARALLGLAEERLAGGLRHAGVLAARDLARDALGDAAPDRFAGLSRHQVPVPAGWPSIAEFNAALAMELASHPGRHPSRIGGEGGMRLRTDDLWLDGRSTRAPMLLRLLHGEIERLAPSVAGEARWIEGRPDRARLRSWSVITRDLGHDRWHLHVDAWMSGVYYVRMPSGAGGGIEFGMPDLPGLPAPSADARRLFHPEPGQMLLFPSHLHHRTYATGSADSRISVAFDVVPVRT